VKISIELGLNLHESTSTPENEVNIKMSDRARLPFAGECPAGLPDALNLCPASKTATLNVLGTTRGMDMNVLTKASSWNWDSCKPWAKTSA